MLEEALKRTAVIGAAGKMGSGISLLLLQEIARCEAEKTGNVGSGEYILVLIDSNETGLFSLRKYLKSQVLKYAEKNINHLRKYFAQNMQLVSNEEIVRAFVDGAMDCLRLDTEIVNAKDATLVFEAIIEDISIKKSLFNALKTNSSKPQYYFTNTSSIPISLLNEECKLQNRIIGYHFYNPPAIQKVLEVVTPEAIDPQLNAMAVELTKKLQKTIVRSHDIAGFIGNGFLIPEVIFACKQAKELAGGESIPMSQSVVLINQVTHDFLLRPMGIFQLMDYVGLDVCQNIAKIMRTYLPDSSLHDDYLDNLLAAGIKGGQNSDGSQKNGIFQYDNHLITGVYDLDLKTYIPIPANIIEMLGKMPEEVFWKNLQRDREKHVKVQAYFEKLFQSKTLGATLARKYLLHSRKICKGLVERKIADKLEDVDVVLENGFFHLYGVANLSLPKLVESSCHR
jgi:3-hydroxyacyl-CoA dehydrogenase